MIKKIDKKDWNNYIKVKNIGDLYSYKPVNDSLSLFGEPFLLGYFKGNELKGIIGITKKNTFFGPIFISPIKIFPKTILFFSKNNSKYLKNYEKENNNFFNELLIYLKTFNPLSINLILDGGEDIRPLRWNGQKMGYKVMEKNQFTYKKKISQNWKLGLSSKGRNQLKKLNYSYIIEEITNNEINEKKINDFYKIYSKTLINKKLFPFSKNNLLYYILNNKQTSKIIFVKDKKNSKIVHSSLYFFDNKNIIYSKSGNSEGGGNSVALDYLLSKKENVGKTIDLNGCGNQSISKFKSQFNPYLENYYNITMFSKKGNIIYIFYKVFKMLKIIKGIKGI